MTIEQGKTVLANMALTAIGLERISNLDQNNDSASYMKDYYPVVLKRLLAERDWNFARRTVDIYRVFPIDEYKNYDYVFSLPEDYVALQRVRPEQYFEVYDNIYLVCNKPDEKTIIITAGESLETEEQVIPFIELTYTKYNEDPMTYSPGFYQYFAYSLASEVAFMLTGDQNIMGTVLSLNNSYQTIAYVEDARVSRHSQPYGNLPWYRNKSEYYKKRYRDESDDGYRYGR